MNPGRRAVARWAWRMLRRDWRQQVLTLLLLIAGVGAAVAGSAMAVNSESGSSGFFGDADKVIRIDGSDPATVADAIAEATERYGTVEAIWETPIAIPGSTEMVMQRAMRPGGELSAPTLDVVDGRYPDGPDEAALTDEAADRFGAGIGDEIVVGDDVLSVVGLVENPRDLFHEFVLTLPDAAAPAEIVELLVDSGERAGTPVPDLPGQDSVMWRDGNQPQDTRAITLMAITAVLALVGLVAAAGFTVLARRRQRQLGLLGAVGASPRELRLVMVVNGIVVGALAAVAGTVVGVAGWLAARSAIESAAGRRIERFDLPWDLVAVAAVLAVVITAIAAWWPARQLSRLSIVNALSGRPAAPRPVHRSLAVAVVFVAVGLALVGIAGPVDDPSPLPLILGLLAVIVGVVFVAPAAVRLLGAVARRLPFAPRLALRDLSRYQSRAAASLAAIAMGIGLCVAIIAVAATNVQSASEGNLAASHLMVEVGDLQTAFDGAAALTAADRAELDDRAAAVVAAAGGQSMVALELAFNPSVDGGIVEPVSVGRIIDDNTTRMIGWTYVATPEALEFFGIDPGSIEPGTELLIAADRADLVLVDASRREQPSSAPALTQAVDLPAYSSAPFALVTEAAIEEYGWETAKSTWFAEFPESLSSDQIDAATDVAAEVGLRVDTRNDQDTLAALRRWTTIVGAALALAIVAMSVGLIRGEAARDIRTLTATGAGPRTRRAITAATATALATVGVVLGVVGAYVFLLASYRSELSELTPLPLGQLLPLAFGLPVVATAAGWLLAGREPPAFSRQALE